jgi:antitoxin component of MazEF toxin-antitoxin module
MTIRDKPIVRTLHKRGSGMCVVIPPVVMRRLGWNQNDALKLDCLQGSLVVTKVKLPSVPDMRLSEVAPDGQEPGQ